VASGSIPLVAGKDGKPDYLRYMPAHSYINIYDFDSVDALVSHLKLVGSSRDEYEKYIWFKRKHNYTREQLGKMSLNEMISFAKTILDPQEKLFTRGIVAKEKSESKLCKVARYLRDTPRETLHEQIKAKRQNRPTTNEACLKPGNLARDFPV